MEVQFKQRCQREMPTKPTFWLRKVLKQYAEWEDTDGSDTEG